MTNFDQGLILGLTMPWWGSVEVPGEKWETLFEGDVETTHQTEQVAWSDSDVITASNTISGLFNTGDAMRLTVDGTATVLTAYDEPDAVGREVVGNYWIGESADTGYDYCLLQTSGTWPTPYTSFFFRSRNPGTYDIKLERKVS